MDSAIASNGLLTLAMTPVTTAWGLAGLWIALIASRLLVLVVQSVGFMRHSARVH